MRLHQRTCSLLIAAFWASVAIGCGSSADDQPKTYILSGSNLSDPLNIWGQTLAVSGRHASIPAGLDLSGAGPVCMGGDTEGSVSVMVAGCVGTEAGVTCQLPESYDCKYVQGTIAGSIVSSAEAMTVTLDSTSYTEGNVNLLGVELLYDGQITVTTTAEGSRVDQAVNLTVTNSGGSTQYANNAYWTVTQNDDQALFSGMLTLPTSLGDLTILSTEIAFQPNTGCAGPVAGRFDLRFGTSEHARIKVQGCGTATLEYINTNDDSIVEDSYDLSPDVLRDVFSLSAADIGGFLSAQGNLSQHVTIYDGDSVAPLIWCRMLESEDAVPLFAQNITLGTRDNPEAGTPVAECLLTMSGAAGPAFIAGTIAFTKGLNGDTTPVKVLQAAAGSISMSTDGSAELTFEQYGNAQYIGDLDHLNAAGSWALYGVCPVGTVAGCEHLTANPWTAYNEPVTVQASYELNHFGAWMTVDDSSANFFAVKLPD